MLLLLIITAVLSTLDLCGSYKLLVVFPYPSRSHSILGEGYVRHLTRAGHDVTYITPYPLKNPPSNCHQIDVSSNLKLIEQLAKEITIENLIENRVEMPNLINMFDNLLQITNETISHRDVQEMMLDPKVEFDAVIVEWMFSELYAGFSAVFNCPYIWSSSVEPHSLVLKLIDEIPNPAYTPDIMSWSIPPFDFFERVKELVTASTFKLFKLFYVSIEEEALRSAFGPAVEKRGRTLPSLEVIKYNASLLLANSYVAFDVANSFPQSSKLIGGYHISDELKPLPEELKFLMDNATNGVIYFSLGTIMQSKTMPMVLKKELLKTFGELKQTVIWKFEEVLPDLPHNVHIVQWAPQQSILAHPNCILFITHGGLLSITESIHYGVPVIGIPLVADQHRNVKRIVSKGFGLGVNMNYDIPKNLKMAVEEVLEDSKYRNRVKELSMIYHDRPVSPGAELVHWVEHVVRTRGALHFRSISLMVPWYQKLYLDLIALILFTIIFIIKVIKYSFTLLCKSKYDLKKKNR